MDGTYISVKKPSTVEITEKKSRFISNIKRVTTEQEAQNFISEIKKTHYNAKHNVFAYILNSGEKKYTDDGEPSKTGGFPVLEMLEKEGITDVACVVTRYFGGILLGTGGLIRAYTKAAKEGVLASGLLRLVECNEVKITIDYTFLSKLEHIVKSKNIKIKETVYLEKAEVTLLLPVSLTNQLKEECIETFANNFKFEVTETKFDDPY